MSRFLKITAITYLIADILLGVSFRFLSIGFERATMTLGILMMFTILPITVAVLIATIKLWIEHRLNRWVLFAWMVILFTYFVLFAYAQVV